MNEATKVAGVQSGLNWGMDGTQVERLHLKLVDSVGNHPSAVGSVVVLEDAVFGNHFGDKSALSHDLKLD